MMEKAKLEYIWLDGYEPTQNMRSKTMVRNNFGGTVEECPVWMFDGSSTKQADGSSSDCLLKPVNIFPDPQRVNGYLVMCEVLNPDGTPHPSNGRATIDDDDNDFWFGYEQEYFIMDVDTQLPLGFPVGGYPGPQGLYYCSVGGKNTHGRALVEEHADLCLEAGINFEGINQEVACGQWEFQIFAKGAKQAGDELWVARYLLDRLTESYGYYIEYHPKPDQGRLERLGHARQLFQRRHARQGWQGTLRQHLRSLWPKHREAHGRLWCSQRRAPDGPSRDPIHRPVFVRRVRPWRLHSRARFRPHRRLGWPP